MITPLLIIISLLSCTLAQRSESEWEDKIGCDKNCEVCNPTTDTCRRCGPSFFYQTSSNSCTEGAIANCNYYRSQTECDECKEGFTTLKGICVQCGIANCGKCDVDRNQCQLCVQGFTSSLPVNISAGGQSKLNFYLKCSKMFFPR